MPRTVWHRAEAGEGFALAPADLLPAGGAAAGWPRPLCLAAELVQALGVLRFLGLLGLLGAEEANVNTRPQRYALATHTGVEIWVQPTGSLVCKHGNTKKILTKVATKDDSSKFRSSRITKCDCALNIPRRVGSIFVKPPGSIKK